MLSVGLQIKGHLDIGSAPFCHRESLLPAIGADNLTHAPEAGFCPVYNTRPPVLTSTASERQDATEGAWT